MLDETMVELILKHEKKRNVSQVVIKQVKLSKFFPDDTPSKEIEETILSLLEDWIRNK